MSANTAPASGLNERTLGALWIVYAIFRLAMALILLIYSGVATVMFGALLIRVRDASSLMGVFHVLYFVTVFVAVLAGLFGLLAGTALLARRASARGFSLVASILSLCDLPLGTTLGTYTLITFLR
ncbi:MAG: hypothetical protein WB607_01435 [Candidatus Acidiferrum sp.]